MRRQNKFLFFTAAFFLLGLAGAAGQTQDNSQNSLLKGSYRFRDVAIQNVDEFYNPTEITASYGTITFACAGNNTISGTQVDNVATNGLPAARLYLRSRFARRVYRQRDGSGSGRQFI